MINSVGPFFVALNDSTFRYDVSSREYIRLIGNLAISLTVVSIVSIFLVIIFAVKPAVWLVEGMLLIFILIYFIDNKQQVLMLFVEIPATVVASLKNRCEKRLLLIRLEREMFNREGVEDGDGNIQCNIEDAENNIANFETDGLVNTDDKADISQTRDVSAQDNFLHLSGRHFTLLKISSILVVCIIYFIVTYWIEYGSVQSIYIFGPSTANYNQLLMTEYLLAITLMTNIAVQPYDIRYNGGSTNLFNATYQDATTAIDLMISIQRSLAFGDDERFVHTPIGHFRKLMFTSSSCMLGFDDYIPADDCSTFYNNILGFGSYNAFLISKNLMSDCLDLIRSANTLNFDSINSTLNSVPFIAINTLKDIHLNKLSSQMSIEVYSHV